MKSKRTFSYLILIIAPLFFGCGRPVNEENKSNASANSLSLHLGNEKYFIIDTKQSVVAWKNSSVEGTHTGYVYISKGELMIKNGQLIGGTVKVAMSTIEGDDHRSDNNLIKHLKGPDFFDVKKFPFSTIVISKVVSINSETRKVTGNLTIKGITHPVIFPAEIEVKSGIIKANGKLIIDRTIWDIRYKSGKFYDNLANNAISDSIEFNIKIAAKNR